jgi:hypothetical protein
MLRPAPVARRRCHPRAPETYLGLLGPIGSYDFCCARCRRAASSLPGAVPLPQRVRSVRAGQAALAESATQALRWNCCGWQSEVERLWTRRCREGT